MRLVSKISLYHFLLSSIVLGLAGILLFIFLRNEISLEIEEQLELQLDMVARELTKGKHIDFPLVEISKGNLEIMEQPRVFKDTLIYDHIQEVSEGYYYFAENKNINGQPYRISVMTTYIGWENYAHTISYIFVAIAVTLVVLGTVVNYFISKNLWAPFLINLKKMQGYSVTSKEELQLAVTNVKEFQEMNDVLMQLAARGKKEYTALKEFTENASHEIQTPLSILQSRLENMSQLVLDQNVIKSLNDAKQAVNRLSKVNKGLLLLAKLENKTFNDIQTIQLDEQLKASYELMDDLFTNQAINISFELSPKTIQASAFLTDVLISNLLSNILAYTPPGKNAHVSLKETELIFVNEGPALNFHQSRLFTRFGKGEPGYRGNGLGLSIVKQICLVNGWEIAYHYQNGRHTFSITLV